MRIYLEINQDENISQERINMALHPKKVKAYTKLVGSKEGFKRILYNERRDETKLFTGCVMSNGHWILCRTEATGKRFDSFLDKVFQQTTKLLKENKKWPRVPSFYKVDSSAYVGEEAEEYLPNFDLGIGSAVPEEQVPIQDRMGVFFQSNRDPMVALSPEGTAGCAFFNLLYVAPFIGAGFRFTIQPDKTMAYTPILAYENDQLVGAISPLRYNDFEEAFERMNGTFLEGAV